MIAIYNNVLKPSLLKKLEFEMLDSKEFPWYFARHNLHHENEKYKTTDTFLFTHNFFINNNPHSDAYNLVLPLVGFVQLPILLQASLSTGVEVVQFNKAVNS